MFYLLIFRVRLPPRLYSGNKKAGKPRSAPFTFWISTAFPLLACGSSVRLSLVPACAIVKPLLGGPDSSDIGNDPAKRSGARIDGCQGKMAFSRCRGNEFADNDIWSLDESRVRFLVYTFPRTLSSRLRQERETALLLLPRLPSDSLFRA